MKKKKIYWWRFGALICGITALILAETIPIMGLIALAMIGYPVIEHNFISEENKIKYI